MTVFDVSAGEFARANLANASDSGVDALEATRTALVAELGIHSGDPLYDGVLALKGLLATYLAI